MHLIAQRTLFSFAKVGFIGLGNMGLPMAINLAKNGHEVFAFDVDAAKEAETKKHNITFRKQVRDVAKDASVFVAMLPNSQPSKELCESEGGLFKNASPDSFIIDSSTISPTVAMALN